MAPVGRVMEAPNMTKPYRVRIIGGAFFTVTEPEAADAEIEKFTLAGAIEAAEEFLADTEHAHTNGFLDHAYNVEELEIVADDGTVMTLAEAKALIES